MTCPGHVAGADGYCKHCRAILCRPLHGHVYEGAACVRCGLEAPADPADGREPAPSVTK